MLPLIYFSAFYQRGSFPAASFHGEVVISRGGSGLFPTFARSSSHSELVCCSSAGVFLFLSLFFFFSKSCFALALVGEGERTKTLRDHT